MKQGTLTTRALLDLIERFEQSRQPLTDIEGQRLRGVPGWDLLGRTTLSEHDRAAWLERVGYAGSYPAPCGDEMVLVDLEVDESPDRFRYRCPDTFRRRYVSQAEAAVYAVSPARFLHLVADLLDIPRALRRGIDGPAVEGVLWQLGRARIGAAHIDTWLARHLAASIEAVFRHLQQPSLPAAGIVLTTGAALPAIVGIPRGYRVIPIREVLVVEAPTPRIDLDYLRRRLVAASDDPPDATAAVRFDPFTNTLHLNTRSVAPWQVRGTKQIAAVKYLVEQLENHRRRVPAGDILSAVYGSKSGARGKRVSNLFSGNERWRKYIVLDDEGYGIRLE